MRKTFVSLLSGILLSSPSFSAELVVDPFDGTLGDAVSGTGSGTGWTGIWTGGVANKYGAGNTFIANGVGSVGVVASSEESCALTSGADISRLLDATYTVGDDTGAGEYPTLYLTFLMENTPSGNVPAGHAYNVRLRTGTTDVVTFGKRINNRWVLQAGGQSVNFTTNAGNSNKGNWFAVVKLAYDGTDTVVTGYLAEESDASLDLTDLATYAKTGSTTITGKASFNTVFVESHNTSTAKVDEIRIGDDLANVSATPDPLLVAPDPVVFSTNNATETLFFEISNAGATQDLTITGVTPGGTDLANITVDTVFPLTIPAGSFDYIDFTFTPNGTYQAAYSATLDLASNDSGSPKTVTLDITNNPDPWIDANNLNLVNNGAPASYSLPVGNLGITNDLTITAVTPDGQDAGTVVIDTTFPLTVSGGSNDVIDFTFTPNFGAVPYTLDLIIDSNDPATPSKTITVNIDVQDPVIAVSTNTLDFGMLPANPGPQVLSVTVTNEGGTQDLSIEDTTGITGDAEFAITSPAVLPITIGPGLTADIEVTFTPGSGAGRFSGNLQVISSDFINPVPTITLTGFVDPAGTIVSRFDFDPNNLAGTTVDLDGSGMTAWTTGDLFDLATGIGALGGNNQAGANRTVTTAVTGNYLRFSSNREGDAQTPLATGGNDESTWTTFTVSPDVGGGEIDFTGGTAVVDTYASTSLGSNTAADWTLYYSTDAGTTWNSLGTAPGAATNGALTAPLGLSWDLSGIGSVTTAVDFILDPVSTGGTNGSVSQRGIGFDNLVISAGLVTPGVHTFATWASDNGIANDPNGDTDKDGIEELVEYALGLDPNVPNGAPGTLVGNLLRFTKGAEAVANGDVIYEIETSTDLGQTDPWTPVDEGDLVSNDGSTIAYTLPGGPGKIFARLKISKLLVAF